MRYRCSVSHPCCACLCRPFNGCSDNRNSGPNDGDHRRGRSYDSGQRYSRARCVNHSNGGCATCSGGCGGCGRGPDAGYNLRTRARNSKCDHGNACFLDHTDCSGAACNCSGCHGNPGPVSLGASSRSSVNSDSHCCSSSSLGYSDSHRPSCNRERDCGGGRAHYQHCWRSYSYPRRGGLCGRSARSIAGCPGGCYAHNCGSRDSHAKRVNSSCGLG